ncbi:MAG: hypothetical protein AB7T15_06960 [Desulfuromonas sp.]|jgi:hypothetical protein|nr:hypothetical protein [Desulfuromonas thiophila]MDY0397278.1 hypothetical protein [Desulfuromonas thiophila]
MFFSAARPAAQTLTAADFAAARQRACWQGRPAPRCFVWRQRWRLLWAALVALLATGWLGLGLQLWRERGGAIWLLLPLVLLLAGLAGSVGRLLAARLEWEQVLYVLTADQLLVRCGLLRRRLLSFPLEQLSYLRVEPLGPQLSHLYLEFGSRALRLSCLEHGEALWSLLRARLEPAPAAAPATDLSH